jgi:ParB-like chromosome segregation protein Spo0J
LMPKTNKKSVVAEVAGGKGLFVATPVQVELKGLQFAPYNPRTISKEVMAALKASLLKHGMVLSLVVQRRSEKYGDNILIGGHQRVRGMREICAERSWEEPSSVPAVVLDVSDAEAKQLNVSLNNIEGDFDPYKLGEMFRDIRQDMTLDDVLATGFAPVEIDGMIDLLKPPDEAALSLEQGMGDLTGFGASITLSVEFGTVEARDEAKAILKGASSGSGQKAGDVMLTAIKASNSVGKLSPRHKVGDGNAKKGDDRRAGSGKKER